MAARVEAELVVAKASDYQTVIAHQQLESVKP